MADDIFLRFSEPGRLVPLIGNIGYCSPKRKLTTPVSGVNDGRDGDCNWALERVENLAS